MDMVRTSLDIYDDRPKDMIKYLKNYGWHFNKKMCEYAVKRMKKGSKSIDMMTKEYLDQLLKSYGVELENNELYDYVYVANMCLADFYGSSIQDEQHLVKYVKDVIDDEDAYDGIVFNRWYADMSKKGKTIDWEEML